MLGETAYRNALKRREQLEREIARNRRDLDEVQGFLDLCDRYAKLEGELPLAVPVSETVLPAEPGLTVVSGMDILPHIRKAILEEGRPLVRGEIVRALAVRGLRVAGEEQARNVGTIMWRAKSERGEYESFDKLGYWPADVPYEPVGYEPPGHDDDPDEDEGEDGGTRASPVSPSVDDDAWRKAAKGP